MNSASIYSLLIARARSESRRKGLVYYERHHIVPRSVGGGNESGNLVLLTAKEHFVAHHLLLKMHPSSLPIQRAFWMMCNSPEGRATGKVTPSLYERTRIGIASKFRHSEEVVAKIREASTGRRHTEEAKKRIGQAHRGVKRSPETREKIGAAKRGHIKSAETRAKLSASLAGRVKSQEHREKLRQAGLGERSHRFGLKWFTNGRQSVMAREYPDGFVPGRLFGAEVTVESE
jgi:hypothetical protein